MDANNRSKDRPLTEPAVPPTSEGQHRTLFETMAQGVVYQDADGHILSVNPAAERILGLSLAQMQDRTSMDTRWKAIHEDGSSFPGATHPSMVALRTGQPVHNVVMGVVNPKTHGHTWLSIDAIPQFKQGRKTPFQVYTVFEDITERKEAERSLREADMRYRAVFEQAGDSIVLVGLETGALVDFNEAAHRSLGYTREEFADLTILGVEAAMSPDEVREAIERVRREGSDRFETTHRTKTGEIRDVQVSNRLISIGGRECAMSVCRDITERKRFEQSLAAVAEEEREKLRCDLHDSLGQQLTGLRFLLASLRRELLETHPGAAGCLAQVEQIARDALMSTGQIARGLEPLPDGPDALFTALGDLASRIAKVYGIRCRFTSRKPVPVENADAANQLFLIAQEAVMNAVKHARPGRIGVSLSNRSKTVRLAVRDDGIGLSRETRHKGMGLRIMQSRATLIGASFDIQPGKSGGTGVTCSWKRTPPA
jgi:PAS domain S-box-containing protein